METSNSLSCIRGTEYIEHIRRKDGMTVVFYFTYKADDGNPLHVFRDANKSLDVCRKRLAEWAEKKRLNLVCTKTVRV